MTKNYLVSIPLAITAFALASPASAETRTVDLASFDKVSASNGIDISINVGGSQLVTAENKDGDFDDLILEVKNGRLRASRKGNGMGWRKRPNYTISVTMPALNSLDLSSGADADVSGIQSDNFSVDVSSGADADISGTCGSLDAEASSGADLDASDLICANGRVDVSSGADIEVHVTQTLSADASSGGSITVYGNPKEVDKDKSSGGSIRISD